MLSVATPKTLLERSQFNVKKDKNLFLRLLSAALLSCSSTSFAEEVDYQTQIQPIFDQYCVACHACFDAPCQLNLGSAEGLLRGANKTPVYNGTRQENATPTRLYIDATSTAEWWEKGFFSIHLKQGNQPSVMEQMLTLKETDSQEPNAPLPDDLELGIGRDNTCPTTAEMANYREDNPHAGMPFALPALPESEYRTLRQWLSEGAPVKMQTLTAAEVDKPDIARWEALLNTSGKGHRLLARWLFEHWSVARLYWPHNSSDRFYRLVRSRTPTGEPVSEIATRRPNQGPGETFYYRFRPVKGTRVYKTHIPLALDDAMLQGIEKDFAPESLNVTRLPGYSDAERANPFSTFAALPAEARYRYMLNNAEYFIRTLIRGPVCRGQLATDVIRDHFWVLFQDPQHDPYLGSADYRADVDPLLNLPGLETDLLDGAASWFDAEDNRNRYLELRQAAIKQLEPNGPELSSIWDDNGNALLTVFRHHDSATVKRGWVGQLPATVWWMDYPLLERSYYNLVVNFDVFGAMSHQLQTRLYFDLIRNGSEQNFLRLLPPDARKRLIGEWYRGMGSLKRWLSYEELDTKRPSGIQYETDLPFPELLTRLLQRYSSINASAHDLNRCSLGQCAPEWQTLNRLSGALATTMPALLHLPEASVLRVRSKDSTDRLYTLVRNRYHSNVAFILGEELRYEPKRDSLTVVSGIATGYPNLIFDVTEAELDAFVEAMLSDQLKKQSSFVKTVLAPWGVRRSHPDFWQVFTDINALMRETEPATAGLLDLNRYIDYR